MAIAFYFDKTLVPSEELAEKVSTGQIQKFFQSIKNQEEDEVTFRGGVVKTTDYTKDATPLSSNFSPIGLGKPLSIEILGLYTGDAPNRFFGGKKDLLVVSGVRAANTYQEATRAINQIVKKIDDQQFIQPSAFDEGSPIVYYSPAIDSSTLLCSVEMVVDTFSEEIHQMVSSLLAKAASTPIFATHSQYLLAGSSILKMASGLGNSIFESAPFLKDELILRFDTPDFPILNSKNVILYNQKDQEEFTQYYPQVRDGLGHHKMELVHKGSGEPYQGMAPYILLSLDGRNRDHDLADFSPKIATAAILEKFYGSNVVYKTTEILETAMDLYNDFHYHNKAKKLEEDLTKMDKTSPEYQKLQKLYEAYLANIRNELFKPK